MNLLVLFVLAAIILVLVIVALSAIRVVQQYERGVIFVLGRLIGAKGPGLFLVPPFISRMMKVDLRIVTLTVPPQEVITRDNVTIKVTAVVYFYVVDPIAAVVNVVNFNQQPRRSVRRPCATSWANQNWMNCWQSATRSTVTCRRSSTSIPSAGA